MKNLLIIFTVITSLAASCSKTSMIILNSDIQPVCSGQVLGDSITVVILTKMNPTDQNVGVVIRSMWDSIPCTIDHIDFVFNDFNQSNGYGVSPAYGEILHNRILFRTNINLNKSNILDGDTLKYSLNFCDSNNDVIRTYQKFHIVE